VGYNSHPNPPRVGCEVFLTFPSPLQQYLPQGLCDNAEPNGVVTHVLPILTHLANDPDVFVQTSTVPAFAVMLQRCSGKSGEINF
jgi:hypothetical protein